MSKITQIKSFSLVFFVFFLLVNVLNAQQKEVNSLTADINIYGKNDTTMVNLLCDLAFNYHLIQTDSTTNIAQRAYLLAKKINYLKGEANATKILAIGSYIAGDFSHALKLNQRAIRLYQQLEDKNGEAAVLNNTANIYHNLGSYSKALEYFNKSLTIRLVINDLKGIASCYNNMGNCYLNMGNYALAIENHIKGLEIREKLEDSIAIANSYSNIAGVYYLIKKHDDALAYANKSYLLNNLTGDLEGVYQNCITIGAINTDRKNYDAALKYFNQALNVSRGIGNLVGQSVCLTNIGEVHNFLNKPDDAITFYKQGLALAEKISDPEGIASCNLGIAESYVIKNNLKEAVNFYKNAYDIAVAISNKQIVYQSAKNLAKVFEDLNESKKAYNYLKIASRYKDSLFNEDTKQKFVELEFNYILEKKQNEIAQLETNKLLNDEKTKRQYIFLIGLVIVILILVLFVLAQLKYAANEKKSKELILAQHAKIEKQKERLEEVNSFKDKMFSVLSHDLRAPVSSLSNVIELIDDDVLSVEDFLNVKSKFREQLHALNILVDNTLHWAKSQLQGELKPAKESLSLSKIVDRNFDLFKHNAQQKGIILVKNFNEKFNIYVDETHLDIVLRNLIGNAIKFTNTNGTVEVSAEKNMEHYVIKIKDTGIGLTQEQIKNLFTYAKPHNNFGTKGENGAGIGLILSNEFVTRNGGTMTVESKIDVGSTFMLTFPLL